MSENRRITVLGAGAWGTALGLTMHRAGHKVTLWARDPALAHEIEHAHTNSRYLPGVTLDPEIIALDDTAATLSGAGCVLTVTPAQSLRAVLTLAAETLAPDVPVVLCAKGIERDTGRLMSEVAREVLPQNPIAVLSGPSFAADVARG
ncbi:2-dehydropantoate 2-reductase N-terminal domain-containing protein, partial [Nitratireductor sp. GCM10026969]|uniref:2-dehydropantoate 2-reductase N-terminal domain-containing protein n=1 Tax=Nitratireductor sp. GCM10026969 TaxID=3252645 RepID=UPI003624418D